MAALGALLDAAPDAPAGSAQPWTPAPPPTSGDLLADNLRHHAAGLRGLLRSRGEPVEDLIMPIYVPITLRPAQQRDQARGNLTALMTVPLPVGVPDPGRRLEQIAAETARRKAQSRPSVGTVFHGPMPRQAFSRS